MADPDPADFIRIVSEIERRPKGVHLLCARQREDDYEEYDADPEKNGETVQGFVRTAKERSIKVLDALKDAVFHAQDEEIRNAKAQLYQMLNEALSTCDLCIPRYYVGKQELREKLRQQSYSSEEIGEFFQVFDVPDLERVTTRLDNTRQALMQAPERQRKIGSLDETAVFSIFEALSCDAFLKSETLLQKHFDEVFKLIQGAKTLKSRSFLPAATMFLFQTDSYRFSWAKIAWTRVYQRAPSDEEWDWTVKEPLEKQFALVTAAPQPKTVWSFWNGLRFILRRLGQNEIIHKLGAIEPDVHNMALRHLAVNTSGLKFILESVQIILEKAPTSFWEALGPIPAATFIENVFSSPHFTKLLQDTNTSDTELQSSAEQVLSWLWPFLSSLNPANLPPATRTLASQLFRQASELSLTEQARSKCFETALRAFSLMLDQFRQSPSFLQASGRITLAEVIDVVNDNVKLFLGDGLLTKAPVATKESNALARSIISNALDMQSLALEEDYRILLDDKPLGHEMSMHNAQLWTFAVGRLDSADVELSEAVLRATTGLVGLEKYVSKRGSKVQPGGDQFNAVLDKAFGAASRIFEKLAEFQPQHLDQLYKEAGSSKALIAALFASDIEFYVGAKELVRTISGERAQKEALSHLVRAFPAVTLRSIANALQRISALKTFVSIPRTLATCFDVLDILTDSQNGVLRTQILTSDDVRAVQELWYRDWQFLQMIFKETEGWNDRHGNKDLVTELCRDAMQYAEMLFEQYDVFAAALKSQNADPALHVDKFLLETSRGSPASTLTTMSKWLRLRDEYLSTTLAHLITKMLYKLSSREITIPEAALDNIQRISTDAKIRTILTRQQKAEIVRALEKYHKRPIVVQDVRLKQQTLTGLVPRLRLDSRGGSDASASVSREQSTDDSDEAVVVRSGIVQRPKSLTENLPSKTKGSFSKTDLGASRLSSIGKPSRSSIGVKSSTDADRNAAFIADRKKQIAEKKAKLAQEKLAKSGRANQNEGSIMAGIGVRGKDHSVRHPSMMVSSGSSEDSWDEDDEVLFGPKKKQGEQGGPSGASGPQPPRPVKKTKMVLHKNDMRSRIDPDLSGLHQTLLGWEFFADSDLPPGSTTTDYTLVSNTFATVQDYQKTFEPLLVLEGWQSFRRAREEGNFRPFEMKISNRLSVDSMVEVNAVLVKGDPKELNLGVADVLLLSKDPRPEANPEAPHCMGRIKEKSMKKGQLEIVFRVNVAKNPFLSALVPGLSIHAVSVLSLTSLEREYGALHALQFYDLAPEIIKAKPSPILNYPEKLLQPLVENYKVNQAQAKAVRSALDNDCFTLIQGPPGSGKTKTICALVGAMLSQHILVPTASSSLNAAKTAMGGKKILVCAPSNAAVDELVMRFKEGVVLMNGQKEKLSIVRLGRSDAINVNIKDVTLEELTNVRLASAAPKQEEDIHKFMMEHKDTSDRYHELRKKTDERSSTGEPVSAQDSQALEVLRKKKGELSLKIDNIRDKRKIAIRDAALARKRIQQSILDGAHILCATLSGSGHELFQNLNIEFETVIIDEAAQSIELSALIPLKYGCSKCVLVGDPKQLPPTVLSKEAARFQFEQSLFARMEKNHSQDIHLLDTQYRMHPEISLYPSKTFYDGKLKDGEGLAESRKRLWHHAPLLGPYRFFDVQGMSSNASSGHSLVNVAEIEVAMKLYERLTTDCPQYQFHGKIVEFNTTDAFQGRESEIIIFSCVRATTKGIGFLSDIRRMNVGLTRAKCSLWVLGNSKTLISGKFWKGLVTDAQDRNRYTDGDVLRRLSRPLLTNDMMKDDVDMGGVSPPLSRRESIQSEGKPKKSGKSKSKTETPLTPVEPGSSTDTDGVTPRSVPKGPTGQKTIGKAHKATDARALSTTIPQPPQRITPGANQSNNNQPVNALGGVSTGPEGASPSIIPGPGSGKVAFAATAPHTPRIAARNPVASNAVKLGTKQLHVENIKVREDSFQQRKQEDWDKRYRKNMGSHDLPIPAVRSTASAENKRKRQEALEPPSRPAPKFPKSDNSSNEPGSKRPIAGFDSTSPTTLRGADPAPQPGPVKPRKPSNAGPPKVFKKGGASSLFIEKKKR